MRSSDDIRDLLLREGVAHEIIELPAHSKTAVSAAELLCVPAGEIVKSLVFSVDGRPTLVLVTGDASVDVDVLRAELGAAEVVLARRRQVAEATGYRPGAVSPVALATPLPVVADPGVFVPRVVYCGGGTTNTMLRVLSADLKGLVQPRLVSVARWGRHITGCMKAADEVGH